MPDAIEKYGFGTTPFLAMDGLTLGRTELGFNAIEARYYGSTTDPVAYSNLHFPQGIPLADYPNMFVADVQMAQISAAVWLFTVQAKGLLGLQAVKRTISTKSQSYTTGPVTIGTDAVAQAQGQYINLSCTFHYVSTTLPALDVEPQNASLPAGAILPTPPSNPFSDDNPLADNYTASPIYNFPSGWLRQGVEVDSVNGAEIYMIKEEWEYKYEFVPG